MNQTTPSPLTVYFDGACPVCSREIALYQRQSGADAVNWVDAAHCELRLLGDDLGRSDALARLHVRQANGQLISGARAFVLMWQSLPSTAWVAKYLDNKPTLWCLELAYAAFLRIRRLWRRA